MDEETTNKTEELNSPVDWKEIDQQIETGAKAYEELLRNAGLDWTHWYATIVGLRGLREHAFAKIGVRNMQLQAFRDTMTALLTQRKYATYDRMPKQDRSDCYRLMDRIDDVDRWYSGLPAADKLRWKHPGTIAKHCPKEYLSGMRRHNLPKKAGKKKPAVNAETERLKALLIQVIKRLAKHEPDALKLLDQIYPADPEDDIPEFTPTEES